MNREDWQPQLDHAIDRVVAVARAPREEVFRYIVDRVAEKHGVLPAEMLGKRRWNHLTLARVDAYRLLLEQRWSYPQIGRAFNRDHSSVLKTLKAYEVKS